MQVLSIVERLNVLEDEVREPPGGEGSGGEVEAKKSGMTHVFLARIVSPCRIEPHFRPGIALHTESVSFPLNPSPNRSQSLQHQVNHLDRQIAQLSRLSSRYSWARLGLFVAAIAISLILFLTVGILPGVIGGIAGLSVFSTAAHYHNRLKEGIARRTLWRTIKQAHLASLALDWDHLPPPLGVDGGPLALDLDLAGDRALHRLIDTCVTQEGSRRLLDWLTADVPDPAEMLRRQALVRELAPRVLLRDKLRLSAILPAQKLGRRWEGRRLRDWLAALPPAGSRRGVAGVLTVLAVLDVVLFALHALGILPPVWGFTFMLYAGLYLWRVQEMGDPFAAAMALQDPLDDLRAVLTLLETTPYETDPHLRDLCAPFVESERCPSTEIKRLTRVIMAASLRGNPMLWTITSAVLPWDVYVAILLDRRRQAIADRLPQWLDAWFEVEALSALANLAYLHPDYTFPVLVEEAGGAAVFEARQIGHPLIPDCVRNDFTLDHLGELALVTGSNMSGKSTFLRTLGLNLCLAYAGGPVDAASLLTVPFRLFTCIRVADSVTDGISYFYAEVKRLKALLVALQADHPFPLCFLIDEIFRGTNNRERLIGSRSYLRVLAGQHGVGAISTHDLELVSLADTIPAIHNCHFAETVADGRLLFDYTLRPGPCPTTNALTIMRMEGLPVDQDFSA